MELPGIHRAGWSPRSPGHGPANPLTTWSDSAALTPTLTHLSPTGAADSLYLSASGVIWPAMEGSTTTATATSPFTQRAAPAWERSESASPKNRHAMTAPTTTTTVTSATITETLMPRRFGVMARWLPVHSLLSQSRRLAAVGVVANAVVAASCPSR